MSAPAQAATPLETVMIDTPTVCCDGAGRGANITPALGHPLVFLTVDKSGEVDCPYCGRRYVLSAAGHAAAHAH